MRSSHSPSIRSRYDYYYSALSPGSSAANFYDNQNLSLFGDPVPPATDFLETLDNHLYGSFRRNSSGDGTFKNASVPVEIVSRPVPYSRDYVRVTSTSSGGSLSTRRPSINPSSIMSPITSERPTSTIQMDDSFSSYRKRSSSAFSDDFRNVNNYR